MTVETFSSVKESVSMKTSRVEVSVIVDLPATIKISVDIEIKIIMNVPLTVKASLSVQVLTNVEVSIAGLCYFSP